MQLREHVAAKDKMEKMIDFSHEEGEQIVTRVRQQDSEAIAKDEVQKVLQLTEGRRSNWEKTWEDQKARLEANLQLCQFYAELRQVCRCRLPSFASLQFCFPVAWRDG